MQPRDRSNACLTAAFSRLTFVLSLIGMILVCTRCGLASGSVINDVNNMLRDVATETESGHIGNVKRASSHKMLRNADDGANDSENNASTMNLIDDESSVELLRFVEDDSGKKAVVTTPGSKTPTTATRIIAEIEGDSAETSSDADDDDADTELSLNNQVRLLTKQLNALMTRRREDYELLEHNLRKSLRITTNAATVDLDIRNELDQLRHEVKALHDGHLSGNKERLTVEWLQQSVAEIRKQLVELQQIASNAAKDVSSRSQSYEDAATIRNDYQQLKLEMAALKERQQQNEVYVQELREELLQQEEDYKRLWNNRRAEGNHDSAKEASNSAEERDSDDDSQNVELSTESLADHKRRHCRFQRQQLHQLQLEQGTLKRQLRELKFHRIGERVRNIEIEQHRIAGANFNLSRQIASLDKLHVSMLELLEDVEGIQSKVDKSIPELRHEISKVEFSNAQLNAEQSLVREEGKNVARSVQAMAMSVSTLQDERDSVKETQTSVARLQSNVDRLQSLMEDVQRALTHQHRRSENKWLQQQQVHQHTGKINEAREEHRQPHHGYHHGNNRNRNSNTNDSQSNNDSAYLPLTQRAESLVAKLENVEQQYESIIDKLPQDCSEAVANGGSASADGLYMIAPAGQHRPLMTHCTADGWTTVQRRYDGSADFNRSWADYADGFGAPAGEYWIGNEQLHHLTLSNCTGLRVLMQDIYDNVRVAEYAHFYISSRSDGYRLHIDGYSGNASDALDYQQGMQFSAIDDDRDISQTHCAANYEGGWWFSHCQHANLNGRYNLGLTWFDAERNEWIAVKSSQMLIKRQTATSSAACAAATAAASATTIVSSKLASDAEAATTTTATLLLPSSAAALPVSFVAGVRV